MSFESLGLSPRLSACCLKSATRNRSPIQVQAIRCCSRATTCLAAPRPAPARPPRSPCRCCSVLDGIRTACRCTARAASAPLSSPRPASWPCPSARQHPHLRQAHEAWPQQHRDLRRRRHEPAARCHASRHRHPRRHAGPPDRPSSSAAAPSLGEVETARSSTKPTACSTWASCPRSSASSATACPAPSPDASVLGDVRGQSIKKLALEFMKEPKEVQVGSAQHGRA